MDLQELERLRKKIIKKSIFFSLFSIGILICIVFRLCIIPWFAISILVIGILIISWIIKNLFIKGFENIVKSELLPCVLNNLTKEYGEIKWKDNPETPDPYVKEIVDNLKQYIDDCCSQYIIELDTLWEKDNLSEEESSRLDDLECDIIPQEKSKIRMQLLDELEKKNHSEYTNEDFIKIEYLKKENEKYQYELELYKLSDIEEDNNELSEDEAKQCKKLESLIDNYDFDIDNYHFGQCSYFNINELVNNEDDIEIIVDASIDDVFLGDYKGIKFIAVERKDGGNSEFFSGTIVKIPLKQEFQGTLFILTHCYNAVPQSGIEKMTENLQYLEQKITENHNIYIKELRDSNILNDKFVNYLNSSNDKFSYMFKNNYAYLMMPHKKDLYKLGSLFKRIDDKKQYQKFEQDLQTMLQELEKFAESINS